MDNQVKERSYFYHCFLYWLHDMLGFGFWQARRLHYADELLGY
jgi:hypothetical protein